MHFGRIWCYLYFRVNLTSSSPRCCWGLNEKMLERKKCSLEGKAGLFGSEALDNHRVPCVWEAEKKRQEEMNLGSSRDSDKSPPHLLYTSAGVLTNEAKSPIKISAGLRYPKCQLFPCRSASSAQLCQVFPHPFCLEESKGKEGAGREPGSLDVHFSFISGLSRKAQCRVVQSSDDEQLLGRVCHESVQSCRSFHM